MTPKDKDLPHDDQIVRLIEEQIATICNAEFNEIGSIEISADTTDDEIDAAVKKMFSTPRSNFTK